jgi:hypothetical protein
MNYSRLAIAAICIIPFIWINAQIAESVSQHQLEATYQCELNGAQCRGRWPNRIIIKE